MEGFRPIEKGSYAKIDAPASLGRPPRLEWLPVKYLLIDPEYQREITNVGRKNIRRIAEQFDWGKFTPVMVAACGSNRFAIVDGQHRTTAAALVGAEKVPCAIVEAERGEQARAFLAINGNTTRLHSVQLHHAALAAGDEKARGIDRVCKAAGVTVCRYPRQCNVMEPGETIAAQTIGKAVARFGEAVTVATLRAIVSTGGGNPGLLNATIIWGSTEVLADHSAWLRDEKKLHAAFDVLDLEAMWRAGTAAAARMKGTSATDQYEAALVDALSKRLGTGKAA